MIRTEWENNGEPNDAGEYVAAVHFEAKPGQAPKNPQRFIGKSHKEVADKLMEAQARATERIQELSGHQKPIPNQPTAAVTGRVLSADERFKLTNELQNPATAPEAVSRIVESQVGVPLAHLREAMSAEEEAKQVKVVLETCRLFKERHPEFYHSQYNAQVIANYLDTQNWDPRKLENYEIAFERLTEAGLLQAAPQQPTTEVPDGGSPSDTPPRTATVPADQPGVTRRPRGSIVSSTGVRPGDSSGVPEPRVAAPKYTAQDILTMPSDVYKEKYASEPGFAALVDKLNLMPQQTAAR